MNLMSLFQTKILNHKDIDNYRNNLIRNEN